MIVPVTRSEAFLLPRRDQELANLRRKLGASGLLYLLVISLICLSAGPQLAIAGEDLLEHGRYVFNAAGCISCHTRDQILAGGRPLKTPFGTFYPPNITPNRKYGIGGWSESNFLRALGEGVSPQGEHYYPSFPYTSYTRMTPEDMRALYAYLMSQPPVARPNRQHELPAVLSSRSLLAFWKAGRFNPGKYQYDPQHTAQWNRGAYLAQALGHCGECHTPRGPLGELRADQYLAGTHSGPEGREVPNITQDEETGIGHWSPEEQRTFLESGRLPDGSYIGPLMAEVLGTSIMSLNKADREALATYLGSLPPVHHDVHYQFDPFADPDIRK